MVWYGMVWYGVMCWVVCSVLCGIVWYGVLCVVCCVVWYVMLCYVMLFCAMLWYDVLCYAILCFVRHTIHFWFNLLLTPWYTLFYFILFYLFTFYIRWKLCFVQFTRCWECSKSDSLPTGRPIVEFFLQGDLICIDVYYPYIWTVVYRKVYLNH